MPAAPGELLVREEVAHLACHRVLTGQRNPAVTGARPDAGQLVDLVDVLVVEIGVMRTPMPITAGSTADRPTPPSR